jgi:hypothetical protein
MAPALLVIWIAAFPVAAHADADGPDCYRVREVAQGDTLALREKPDHKSAKLADIPNDGNGLANHGKCEPDLPEGKVMTLPAAERERYYGSRWCQVSFKGRKGWVKAKFLGEGECPEG